MTDAPDPSRLLASAALDNEVTADERAQVDASAFLRAEMETYADLRGRLADVHVPRAARETAISAALAEFDAMHGLDARPSVNPAAATPLAPVASLHARRQRQIRWLGGVAAAGIVALVGVALVRSTGGEDNKSSATQVVRTESAGASEKASATTSAPQPESAPAAELPATTAAAGTGAETAPPLVATAAAAGSADTAAGGAADATVIDPWAGAPSFATAPELTAFAFAAGSPLASAAGSATAATEAATETTQAADGGTTTTVALAVPAPAASVVLDETTVLPCDTAGLPTVAVVYMGERVLLVRDDALGQLQVIDPSTCTATSVFELP